MSPSFSCQVIGRFGLEPCTDSDRCLKESLKYHQYLQFEMASLNSTFLLIHGPKSAIIIVQKRETNKHYLLLNSSLKSHSSWLSFKPGCYILFCFEVEPFSTSSVLFTQTIMRHWRRWSDEQLLRSASYDLKFSWNMYTTDSCVYDYCYCENSDIYKSLVIGSELRKVRAFDNSFWAKKMYILEKRILRN